VDNENKSGWEVLFASVMDVTDQEKYRELVAKTLDSNVKLAFNYTREGINKWVRTPLGLRGDPEATCESGVFDASGATPGTMPVFLSIVHQTTCVVILRFGKEGPKRDSNQNSLLRDLAELVFGQRAVEHVVPIMSEPMPWAQGVSVR